MLNGGGNSLLVGGESPFGKVSHHVAEGFVLLPKTHVPGRREFERFR